MARHDHAFSRLIDDASTTPIDGWHFSFLEGRQTSTPLPWDYERLAAERLASAAHVLDVDTGGGEVLARLAPPAGTIAVEDWPPNIPMAAARLQPLGVEVRQRVDGRLPVADAGADLVLNRHGDLDLAEAARVLRPGGVLLTQQIAAVNEPEIGEALGAPAATFPNAVRDLDDLAARVEEAGLVCEVRAQAAVVTRYLDVGALVLQLRAVPWQAPGFVAHESLDALRRVHQRIEAHGSFDVTSVRFLLHARRPR
ncbi:class I SAM-dependent methyltransferase [Cellulomonas chengniuliangii]|uniref:class I SAM-dependent methyltransferase n=1 Tax=Cellulomonas chengniuliangii TaxID=2968084 RepID=UPI001D0DD9FA|nr:methyltransferase domain-containing protein [Cellulomonas chengniuliangii]MCC2316860.1 class I SAM-dependent methyltransferase [Cellulomonas chengniuliangii]